MPLGTKLYAAKTPGAPLICLLADAGEGDEVRARLTDAGADVSLAVIDGLDWNRDLSPWPAPAVFKGGEVWNADMATGYIDVAYGTDDMPQQVSEELKAEVEALKEKIISGEITVPTAFE